MTKSSAIAQLRNRYDANVNGVQVVAGSNPATPTRGRLKCIERRAKPLFLMAGEVADNKERGS